MSRPGAWFAEALAGVTDLVLPAACAGCGAAGGRLRYGVCDGCADELVALVPGGTRPNPAPPGLPTVVGVGPYEGPLREALLAYKEHARHTLAAPLGGLLAEAVATAVPRGPLLLIPVPSSARAARARHGDHLARLAGHAARRLRRAGRAVRVTRPLRALPRPDSAGLTAAERAAAAAHGFRVRPGRAPGLRRAAASARVVLLDDVVTTGATLAAVTTVLGRAGIRVSSAAVLTATRRRYAP